LFCPDEERRTQSAGRIKLLIKQWRSVGNRGVTPMLAEKFILLIEALRSRSHPDGSPIVVSTSRHVPIKLPAGTGK
jgi:hypothetical protein